MNDKLTAVPIAIKAANAFIKEHHRHNKPVYAARFAVGAMYNGELIGVAIVGNPVARLLAKPNAAEVVRLCVKDGSPKGSCSFLYARCWRIWEAMGGKKLYTYTLQSESGASLRGAGWNQEMLLEARSGWDTPKRRREYQAVYGEPKIRWSKETA